MIDTTDQYARSDNPLTRVDPRIKLICSLLVILMCIISPSPIMPLAALAVSLVLLLVVHIPAHYLFRRWIAPLTIASTALFLKLFFTAGEPILTIGLFGLQVTDTGLASGILVMAKVMGAVSILLFLAITTRLDHIAWAAGRLYVPHLMVEMLVLVYRYVFVLMDEVAAIRRAQRSRLGYGTWKSGFRSTGTLFGMLFIRAFDRSEGIHAAMVSRGYRGTYHIDHAGKNISPFHIISALLLLLGFAAMLTG